MNTRGIARLMVVDGAEESRRAVAEHFTSLGWEVVAVADGIQALAQTIAGHLDAIVMNATLPALEGYEAAAILRKINPGMPIILTLGSEAEEQPRESERKERFLCFPKPLDLDAIARAIQALRAGGSAGAGSEEGAR